MLLGGLHIVPLGQNHIGTEIWFIELREEVLRHTFHSHHRTCKKQHNNHNNRPTTCHESHKHTLKPCLGLSHRNSTLAQHIHTKERHLCQRQQPAEQQREGNNNEERFNNLGHRRGRKVERQERKYGNERSTQQPPLRSVGTLQQSLAHRKIVPHAPYCIIHHHNGVIDKHTHGNNESCQ